MSDEYMIDEKLYDLARAIIKATIKDPADQATALKRTDLVKQEMPQAFEWLKWAYPRALDANLKAIDARSYLQLKIDMISSFMMAASQEVRRSEGVAAMQVMLKIAILMGVYAERDGFLVEPVHDAPDQVET